MNRREHILEAATRLFAEKGYEGASMSDLADRVGLRKASLFHHFASKEELREAVLARLVDEVGTAIAKSAMGEGSYVERLDALSAAVPRVLAVNPYAARVLFREAMEWRANEERAVARGVQRVLDGALEFIRGGQQRGVFRAGDPAHYAISLTGLHFMPFVIAGVVEGLGGGSPFSEAYVNARIQEVQAQVRALLVV